MQPMVIYLRGRDGLQPDPAKARHYLEAAVEAGDGKAPTVLARATLSGDLPGDRARAAALLKQQITAGRDVGAAAAALGSFYMKGGGGIAADPAKARAYLEQAIASGQEKAVLSLGRSLLRGDGVAMDRSAGARLLESVAESDRGRAPGIYLDIGKAFMGGEPPDPRNGRAYLERAAQLGSAKALVELGRAALAGKFGANGGSLAIGYFQKAISAGESGAVTRLADIYIGGKGGVAKDVRAGLRLLSQAADAGDAAAMRQMISIYLLGVRGQVSKDFGRARSVFEAYRHVAEPDEVRTQAMLIEAAQLSGRLFGNRNAGLESILSLYMDINPAKRGPAAQQLLRINREAAVFIAQAILKSAGFYTGAVNGVYAPDTIDAIQKACRAGGSGKCGPKTLHGDTFGFIARNFS